jgi:glycosyltransferase involved in cell wall biosynthesis
MRLGIIARSDNTGLGNQTRELVNMLNPTKIMLINSTSFNRNKQHPEWYNGYDIHQVRGFPKHVDITSFLRGLDVVLTCETFYSNQFIDLARRVGVKTVLQYNYEYLDHLNRSDFALPDVFLGPSLWNFDHMTELFGSKTNVTYLPPPTDHTLFDKIRENNYSKHHNRLLHIGGKAASEDRNGTKSVVEMLKYSQEDFQVVIRTQTPLDLKCDDPRLIIDNSDSESRESMYDGFDAMILPRRYAGLCLPMNEALMSGLPVFMTDISPNNKVLPKEWLAKSDKIGILKTRAVLDVYAADPRNLARIVDNYMKQKSKIKYKQQAFEIGMNNFATENLKQKYLDILEK